MRGIMKCIFKVHQQDADELAERLTSQARSKGIRVSRQQIEAQYARKLKAACRRTIPHGGIVADKLKLLMYGDSQHVQGFIDRFDIQGCPVISARTLEVFLQQVGYIQDGLISGLEPGYHISLLCTWCCHRFLKLYVQ